jgi:hypothetical protein
MTVKAVFFNVVYILQWSGIRRNCLSSGKSQLLYLFIRRVIKQNVVIIEVYHFSQLHTKFYPKPTVKVNSICSGNYCGSSVLILMQ